MLHFVLKLKKNIFTVLTAVLCVMLLSACKGVDEPQQNQTSEQNVYVSIAEELKAFFEGAAKKAILKNSIEINSDMLCVSKARGTIEIDGAGFVLTGSGDCVIRLESETSILLNNITIVGGMDTIGCMADSCVSGKNLVLKAQMSAIRSNGKLVIGKESDITAESSLGYGIMADTLEIEDNASVKVSAEKNAVNILKKRLVLAEGSLLDAVTKNDYSAVKCTGTLVMNDGSAFIVKNKSEYHGAQIDYIEINGDVTIKARGGDKGAGLFIFGLEDDYTVNGYCKSDLRKENGQGSIEFKD